MIPGLFGAWGFVFVSAIAVCPSTGRRPVFCPGERRRGVSAAGTRNSCPAPRQTPLRDFASPHEGGTPVGAVNVRVDPGAPGHLVVRTGSGGRMGSRSRWMVSGIVLTAAAAGFLALRVGPDAPCERRGGLPASPGLVQRHELAAGPWGEDGTPGRSGRGSERGRGRLGRGKAPRRADGQARPRPGIHAGPPRTHPADRAAATGALALRSDPGGAVARSSTRSRRSASASRAGTGSRSEARTSGSCRSCSGPFLASCSGRAGPRSWWRHRPRRPDP